VDEFVKFREDLKNFDPKNDQMYTEDEVNLIAEEFLVKAKEYMER